jgi:hypothetical protein
MYDDTGLGRVVGQRGGSRWTSEDPVRARFERGPQEEVRRRMVSLFYLRKSGCFIALYGVVFIVLGSALGVETGLVVDVVGLRWWAWA